MLKYLVDCALPQETTLAATHDGKTYHFKGSGGIAPEWLSRGLTDSEQRWISACMLARVNHFGKKIRISMRARPDVKSSPDFLQSTEDERKDFSVFEGGFFGNIFLENPVAYTCRGKQSIIDEGNPMLNLRVCTESSGEYMPNGDVLTRCGFILTGECENPNSFSRDDIHYEEVILTYLGHTT